LLDPLIPRRLQALLADHLVRIESEQDGDAAFDVLEVGLRDQFERPRFEDRIEAVADLQLEVSFAVRVCVGDRAAEVAVLEVTEGVDLERHPVIGAVLGEGVADLVS
jgi:hypothetical protein